MTKQQLSPSIHTLIQEGARLSRLYADYVADRSFLADDGARIVYFCDAHDIMAYINPNTPHSLDGFRTEAERMAAPERDPDIRLRSDQILSGLLFEPGGVVGLLPSHGKQLDNEIAYQGKRFLLDKTDLLQRARAETARIYEPMQRYLAAAGDGLTDLKVSVVMWVRDNAPALVALLRDELDSPRKRLQAVLAESGLAHWDALEWADFGADDNGRPADEAPSIEEVATLRAGLAARPYRRNTNESNWTDASALAYIARLNAEVGRRTNQRAQVRLVTRAWTLLQAAIDLADKDEEPILVRHPRLLALSTDRTRELDGAGSLTLETALGIYRTHLISLAKAQGDADASPHTAAKAFVDSWDGFEKSRLALEAKPLLASAPTDHWLFGKLVEIFRSTDRPEVVLNRMLVQSFAEFGESAAGFLLNEADLRQPARIDRAEGTSRVQITPLTTCSVGPLELVAWPGIQQAGGTASLDDVAHAVKDRSRAERFLVWSMALASAGRWKQAGFFAQAGRRVAELEGAPAETGNEAVLLRAEIRRLGSRAVSDPDDEIPDPLRRFEIATGELAALGSWSPSRVTREEAAQTAEAFLLDVQLPDLADRVQLLALRIDTHAAATTSALMRARLIAMLLLMHLIAERRPQFWQHRTTGDKAQAQRRRHELGTLFERLRDEGAAEALPLRARALALIAARLAGAWAESSEETTRVSRGAGSATELEDMRDELAPIQVALEDGSDGIAEFLRGEINAIATEFRLAHSPKLLLAPVHVHGFEARLRALEGEFARQAVEAYASTRPVLDAFLGGGLEGHHIAPIESGIRTFDRLVASLQNKVCDDWLRFHLCAERLYFRLLGAIAKPDYLRQRDLEFLDVDYEALGIEFPLASLPYVRRHYIADALEKGELALKMIERALELVERDPYLAPGPAPRFHWLQSFVHRRYIVITISDSASRHFGGNAAEQSTRLQIEELARAFADLMHIERRDIVPSADKIHATEAMRRTNNLVQYASLLLERGGVETLAGLANDQELDAMERRLAPEGVGRIDDANVLHTLGCYFAARSRREDAFNAGSRILELVSQNRGERLRLESGGAGLADAKYWMSMHGPLAEIPHDGQDPVPLAKMINSYT